MSAGPFADVQVRLLAQFEPQRLLPFLSGTAPYSLEYALEVAAQHDLVREQARARTRPRTPAAGPTPRTHTRYTRAHRHNGLPWRQLRSTPTHPPPTYPPTSATPPAHPPPRAQVYVLGRMGDARRALALIMDKIGDVSQAIQFVQGQADDELWEELLNRSLTSSALVARRAAQRPEPRPARSAPRSARAKRTRRPLPLRTPTRVRHAAVISSPTCTPRAHPP